jgi:3-oxoacyl-[acyl-carrier-protein] synthase-3
MSPVIAAVAHYVPPTVVRNAELATRLGVSEDWIVERTGIRERRILEHGATSDLIVPAAEECLRRAGLSAADIDCVLVATITPDYPTPATAAMVIARLGARRAWGFDLSAACSGFLYGLVVAAQLVQTGAARRVLVAGADRMSCITDPNDRRTAVLLGDGAGVAVVECGDDPAVGLQDFVLRLDPKGVNEVLVPAGGSRLPATADTVAARKHCLFLAGPRVFKAAVEGLSGVAAELMARNRLTPADVDWFFPHQANLRILEAVADRLALPRNRMAVNVERFGNTSAATIPIVLSEWHQAGRLKRGDRLVMFSIGAGYTFGAVYFVWAAAPPARRD